MTKTVKKLFTLTLCVSLALTAGLAVIGINVNPLQADEGATPPTVTPTFTVVDGTKNKGKPEYYNLYDGDVNTKYCIQIKEDSIPSITLKADDISTVVTGYSFCTGNDTEDYSGRNPSDWTLYGKNDNSDWVIIDEKTDNTELPAENYEWKEFTFTNNTPYLYYKFDFTGRQGGTGSTSSSSDDWNLMQLSEIKMIATVDENVLGAIQEVDSAEDLKEVFANGGRVKLINDINLDGEVEVYKKTVELDLNGHVLSGSKITVNGATAEECTSFIIKDGNPTATHTDTTLPKGGVIKNEIIISHKEESPNGKNPAILFANGGTVTEQVQLGTDYSRISYFGNATTHFKGGLRSANGGTVAGGVYYGNGIEEVSGKKSVTIDGKKITYKNGGSDYAVQVVEANVKAIAPEGPTKEGCEIWGWYDKNAKTGLLYDFTDLLTTDLTLTAVWGKQVASKEDMKTAVDNGYSVKLTADITLTDYLTIAKEGNFVILDLNGHVLSGGDNKSLQVKGHESYTELMVIDSNPTATHTDTLPKGGICNVEISMPDCSWSGGKANVYANGGTISSVYANSGAGTLNSTSETPSVIKNVEMSGNMTVIGGLYYFDLETIKYGNNGEKTLSLGDKKITFLNDGVVYAKAKTSIGKMVAPEAPDQPENAPSAESYDGYTFSGWYDGDTKYDFNKTLTSNLTLTAKWEDKVAPVITVTKTIYCETSDEIEVTVNDYQLDYVKVNGVTQTLDADNKFKLDLSDKADKYILAVDKSGNEKEVVVEYEHTYGDLIPETPATCYKFGRKAHYRCSVCDKDLDSENKNAVDEYELNISKIPHTYDDDNDDTCNADGCDYKRILPIELIVGGYGLNKKVSDFSVELTDRGQLTINTKDLSTNSNDKKSECYLTNESDAYFMPYKDYYLHVELKRTDSKVGYTSITKDSIKINGVSGTIYAITNKSDNVVITIKLPVITGTSTIATVPQLQYELSGYTAGNNPNAFTVTAATTNTVTPTVDTEFYQLNASGSFVTMDKDNNPFKGTADAVHKVKFKLIAPEGYTFYGFKAEDLSFTGITGLTLDEFKISNGGSYVEATYYLPSLAENHEHSSDSYEKTETEHYKVCTCHAIFDRGAHDFSGENDCDCGTCGYVRTLTIENGAFTIIGYSLEAPANSSINVNTSTSVINLNIDGDYGKAFYLSLSDDFDNVDAKIVSGRLMPNKQYYLFVRLSEHDTHYDYKDGITADKFTLSVGENKITAKSLINKDYAVFELPLLQGASSITKIETVKIKITGYTKDETVGNAKIAFDGDHNADIDGKFYLNDAVINDVTKQFVINGHYRAIIKLTAKDGYTFYDIVQSNVTVTVDDKAATIESLIVSADGYSVTVVVDLSHPLGENHVHTLEKDYTPSKSCYYKRCSVCEMIVEEKEHVYQEGRNFCRECGYVKPVVIENVKIVLSNYEYCIYDSISVALDGEGVSKSILNPYVTEQIDGGTKVFSGLTSNTVYYLHVFVKIESGYAFADNMTLQNFTLEGYGNAIKVDPDVDLFGNEIYSITFEMPKLEAPHLHDFDEWINEVPATCTENGTKGYKDCSYCNKHFDNDGNEITDLTISAGHTFGEWINEVAATTEAEGVKGHKDCSVCGKHFDEAGNEITDLKIEKISAPATDPSGDNPAEGPSESTKDDDGGLSGGAVAGIVIGSVAVAGIGGFAIVWFVIKKYSFAALIASIKGIFRK